MSAFIVSDKTMSVVVNAISFLCWEMPAYGLYGSGFRREWEEQTGIDPRENAGDLYRALFDLNTEAVDQRYNEENVREYPKYDVTLDVNNYQRLKSMQCLLYQCSEGNVPESRLYKMLERSINRMALHIAEGAEQYDKANWDHWAEVASRIY